jgi:hypothetical protein
MTQDEVTLWGKLAAFQFLIENILAQQLSERPKGERDEIVRRILQISKQIDSYPTGLTDEQAVNAADVGMQTQDEIERILMRVQERLVNL